MAGKKNENMAKKTKTRVTVINKNPKANQKFQKLQGLTLRQLKTAAELPPASTDYGSRRQCLS